jgi:hypothetical protein
MNAVRHLVEVTNFSKTIWPHTPDGTADLKITARVVDPGQGGRRGEPQVVIVEPTAYDLDAERLVFAWNCDNPSKAEALEDSLLDGRPVLVEILVPTNAKITMVGVSR